MKKKVTAVCATVALAAVALGGATLAYFTDAKQVENNFTIGDVAIDLWENTGVTDGDGNAVQDAVEENRQGETYSNLMPTYSIDKEPIVKNTGSQTAYVRVAVVVNNLVAINDAIDGVYEGEQRTDEQIQAIYDNVFEGWGLSYLKTADEPRRLWMDEADHLGSAGVEVLGIDMLSRNAADYGQYSLTNLFMSDNEVANKAAYGDGIVYFGDGDKSYYGNAAKVGERVFVFYLKMDAGKQFQLFDGLNVPSDFTADQMKMFDGLKIGIYADAIQAAGFNDTTDEATGAVTTSAYEKAFNALEAEHSLGYWNAGE